VNPGKDADYSEDASSLSGLQIQLGIAHVEDFSYVGSSRRLHGAEDHVWGRPPVFHVITADIGAKSVLPASGLEDEVGN
jgi:hypothetical protein